MSAIQVSRLVRSALETRFDAVFSTALAAACAEFGIPQLAYVIDFSGTEPALEPATGPDQVPTQNYFRGDWSLDELLAIREPDFPVLAMWTGSGQNLHLQMPRTFSGYLEVFWRIFLPIPMRMSGLVDLREATEAAMLACLDAELVVASYRGDLSWDPPSEPRVVSQDEDKLSLVQSVTYRASFEVNV